MQRPWGHNNVSVFEEQNGKCPMTGVAMKLRTQKREELSSPESASLDRIDNNKGYVKGNVRFVTYMYNMARNKFSVGRNTIL